MACVLDKRVREWEEKGKFISLYRDCDVNNLNDDNDDQLILLPARELTTLDRKGSKSDSDIIMLATKPNQGRKCYVHLVIVSINLETGSLKIRSEFIDILMYCTALNEAEGKMVLAHGVICRPKLSFQLRI
jgi:hypothetical protein